MAALPPLAPVGDLEDRLGRSVTSAPDLARAEALLRDASAAVRRFTEQEITFRRSTELVRVNRGVALLAQAPVTAVLSATDTNGVILSPTWYGEQTVQVGAVLVVNGPSGRSAPTLARITYEHGYEAVPDELIAIVCQIAGRAYGRPPDQTGNTSETVGSYSVSIGPAAAAGAVGMLPDEVKILARYRPARRAIQLGSWT